MNYDQTIAQAPGTIPEQLKAAIIACVADIQKRLDTLEATTKEGHQQHEP